MAQLDPPDMAGTLPGWAATIVAANSAEFAELPERWQPIASAVGAEQRRPAALALWNADLTAMLPQLVTALDTHLVDVRACATDHGFVLAYLVTDDSGRHTCWVGRDPRGFAAPPRFWDSFPPWLQRFLREVHAGFTSPDHESFGVMAPSDMQTLAERADFPEGIPGWEDGDDISSTRLLVITKDSGNLHYCLSPDLDLGQVALVYEGDIDPLDLAPELDNLMASYVRPR
ncbi:hypothetical protein [Micromonospora sp. NPDC005203]|uniref:hypothetical protein n=1 Tax=Micromonospora sp. NPDC005203 TaxID=3364226 RepID=UPI0036AF6190